MRLPTETTGCRRSSRESAIGTTRRSLLLGSTADQSRARQENDLTAFAARAGYEVVGTFKETGSGTKLDRAEWRKIMALAQRREIDAVLVTELSRWGRSTLDLLQSLKQLENWRVSVIAMNGLAFLSTPHGRMIATIISA